jgi:tetrahydromethanopterin S-methyltransferase subunit G
VELMTEEWTDRRLDALNAKVDRGFAEVDRRFGEVDRRFTEVDRRLDKIDRHLERIGDRLDSIQRAMIQALIAITGSILAGFTGIIVLIATQL